MTHDELLDRIYWHWRYVQGQDGLQAMTDYRKALLAVVELHKPKGNFADTYIDGEPNNPYCPECIDPDVYPCPTIQVIEKELG